MLTGVIISIFLAISLLTTPTPRTTTQFNLTITESQIIITHTGGESLQCDHLAILMNSEPVPFSDGSIDCPWSIGETLTIPLTSTDTIQTIRILYDSGKGPSELLYTEIPAQLPEPGTTSIPTPVTTTIPLTPTPTSTPGLPLASFNATPKSGPVPLPVQFTDTSTGVPEEWLWSFGDGMSSTLKDPRHTYMREGSYQVGLTVKNAFGGHTRISQGYITVTPAGERDIFLEAQRGAAVSPGGFIEFTVTKPGTRIKIGGGTIDLPAGARVRLTVDDGGKGKVSIRDGSIVLFAFDMVTLSTDGIERTRGAVQDISVPGYDGLLSSINLEVAGGSGDIRILEEGLPVSINATESHLVLTSLRPGASGMMTLDCYQPDSTSFQGAVTSYSIV
ncbi:MAG: PKD domain-containing protein [Methanolinea sp.]|nr:PKD domain-containing protein [Methanolinea sp.]